MSLKRIEGHVLSLASALAFALILASAQVSLAEPSDAVDASMDDILSGFDDEDASGDSVDDEMDDVLGGFDDEDDFSDASDSEADSETEIAEERIWALQGDVNFGLSASLHDHESSTGTDYSGLQRFRTKLALQLDVDLPHEWKLRTSGYGFYDLAYAMNGRHEYTKDVRDTYEYDFELTDTYVEGSLHDNVDLKVGRQVVNWGRSESIRVLDIINPLDNKEPGLVDIEDIRRSVAMAKFGFFHGPWTLTVLAIPEVRYDILPTRGSDFVPDATDFLPVDADTLAAAAPCAGFDPMFPPPPPGCDPVALAAAGEVAEFLDSLGEEKAEIASALFETLLADLENPKSKVANDFGKGSEFAMNLTGVFSGWDVSIQAARFNNDDAHFDVKDQRYEHARLWMVGTGANYTVGSWLFKGELAYLDGFEYLWATDKKSRVDAMLGVEYYGINDVNIVFEVAERHINDFEDSMKLILDFAQEDTIESALRVSLDFLNDQLHFTLLGVAIGEKAQDGSIVRISGEYDVFDAFSVEAGFLLFQSGDQVFFSGVGDNDRFFAGAKYSF